MSTKRTKKKLDRKTLLQELCEKAGIKRKSLARLYLTKDELVRVSCWVGLIENGSS